MTAKIPKLKKQLIFIATLANERKLICKCLVPQLEGKGQIYLICLVSSHRHPVKGKVVEDGWIDAPVFIGVK